MKKITMYCTDLFLCPSFLLYYDFNILLLLPMSNQTKIKISFRTLLVLIVQSFIFILEPVKSNELAFIKIFILENLNIDSAPFHQYLLSQVHTLLIRIRDSLAQQHRSVSQNNAAKLDLNQLSKLKIKL